MILGIFLTMVLFISTYVSAEIADKPGAHFIYTPIAVFLWVFSACIVIIWLVYILSLVGVYLNVHPITVSGG